MPSAMRKSTDARKPRAIQSKTVKVDGRGTITVPQGSLWMVRLVRRPGRSDEWEQGGGSTSVLTPRKAFLSKLSALLPLRAVPPEEPAFHTGCLRLTWLTSGSTHSIRKAIVGFHLGDFPYFYSQAKLSIEIELISRHRIDVEGLLASDRSLCPPCVGRVAPTLFCRITRAFAEAP